MKFTLSPLLVLFTMLAVSAASPISIAELKAQSSKGMRLISLAEGVEPVWKTEAEVLALIRAEKNFVSCSFHLCQLIL